MRRDPPETVKRALRQEVNFGCPVRVGPNGECCASPLLWWHHFAPPWHVKEHHEPDGMIAICSLHHPMADRGIWSDDTLRYFKANPPTRRRVRESFLWSEKKILVRVGGCYFAASQDIITMGGERMLWTETSADGRVLFSLRLRDDEGREVLKIDSNTLDADTDDLWDLSISVGADHLRAWMQSRRLGLDMRFRRISAEDFRLMAETDIDNAAHRMAPDIIRAQQGLQDVSVGDIGQIRKVTPEERDHRFGVMLAACQDSTGTIPMIDIRRLHIVANGLRIRVPEEGGIHIFDLDGFSHDIPAVKYESSWWVGNGPAISV